MANIVNQAIAKPQGGDYDADYLTQLAQAQRRQAMAQALTKQSMQDPQIDPRGAASWTQGLAKMLQGYQGAKMAGDADAQLSHIQAAKDAAEQASFDKLYSGQSTAQAPAGSNAQALASALKGDGSQPAQDPPASQAMPQQAAQQAPQSPYNSMSLFGDPARDRAYQRQVGTAAYMKAVAENLKPTDTVKNWNAQGIDPRSMAEATRAELAQKGRVSLNGNQYDTNGKLLISAPDANGYYQTQNPNGSYTANESRGATGLAAGRAGATTAATEAQKFSPTTLASGAQVNLPQGMQLQATMGGGLPQAGGNIPIGQTTFGKNQAEKLADQDVKNQQGYKDQFQNSTGMLNNIAILKQLNPVASQGSLANLETGLAQGAASLGIDVGKFKSSNELASAISNDLVLKAKNAGGTNQMPGAMSDADRNFLATTAPQLTQTREGREQLMNWMQRKAQRDQEISQLATQYAGKKGDLQGFDTLVQDRYKDKPLYTESDYKSLFGGKKEATYTEDEYTRLLKKHGFGQ